MPATGSADYLEELEMRQRMRSRSFSTLCVVGLLMMGCAAPEPEAPADAGPPDIEAVAAEPQVWEKDGLRVTPLTDSPRFTGAALSIAGVDGALPSGAVAFDFQVEGYELGGQTADAGANGLANSAKGQHIHLILDNGPYSAHYEPTFEREIEDGHHVMLAFLSRSYHESVKEPTAYVLGQFTVGESAAEPIDLEAAHMFYSRPKGVYKGADTERLMLDFFLANTALSADGNRVRATINGTEFVFTEWVPYVIEGLPMGEIEIGLELLDAAGEPVPGPFNRVTRTVTLEAAEEEAASG